MRRFLRRAFDKCCKALSLEIRRRHRRRPHPGDTHRFDYQRKLVDFSISPGERVLDVGSGHDPFPLATVLGDRYLGENPHRVESIVRDERPLIIFDVEKMPFADKSFDFIYCSHLLEHTNDPLKACSELMRVGHRGYIETPTFGKDMLFSWAERMHKWNVVAHQNELHFFEYTARQKRGCGSDAWREAIFGEMQHPLQELFFDNQDLFNVMFLWKDHFNCIVHRLNTGSVTGEC